MNSISKSEVAIQKFSEGYNCAQAVFYAFCDDLSFDKDVALKLATGFGGGMGGRGDICGAIAGGILVLGLVYGRGQGMDVSAKELTYEKTRHLLEEFSQRFSTLLCRELLGNHSTGEDVSKRHLFESVCKPAVEAVVEVVERLLKE